MIKRDRRIIQKYQRVRTFIFSALLVFQSSTLLAYSKINVAIVIDDIGNSKLDFNALNLPRPVTLSILPYTPYAKKIARQAGLQNREVLLHIPMQAKANNHLLGKGALLLNMNEMQFKGVLEHAIKALPIANGMNNHMGSELTERVVQMGWAMEVLKKQGVYFLDSRTTAKSIAEVTAKAHGVAALHRHVFLDNIKTNKAMEKQFQHALKLAKKNKNVVIIAHPYPSTIKYLQQRLTIEKDPNIQLVPLNSLLSASDRVAFSKRKKKLLQAKVESHSLKETQ